MYFESLLRALHVSDRALVIVLDFNKVYFDDASGDDESSGYDQAVGGVVASAATCGKLEEAWSGVLAHYGVREFHARKFERRVSGFTPAASERTPFLSALAAVVANTVGRGGAGFNVCAIAGPEVVSWCRQRTAEDHVPTRQTPTNQSEIWINNMVAFSHDEYAICLSWALKLAVDFTTATQQPLEVFVSHKPKRTGRAEAIYAAAKITFGERLSGIHNGLDMTPDRVVPLQAADLVAYYLSRDERMKRGGSTNNRAWVVNSLDPRTVKYVPFPPFLAGNWLS